ncbi:MAG: hypothetical protein ABEJ99_05520 [Candidatus Nanohaloarchaea archaeon]
MSSVDLGSLSIDLDNSKTGTVDPGLSYPLDQEVDSVFVDINIVQSATEGESNISKIPAEYVDDSFLDQTDFDDLGESDNFWDVLDPSYNLKFIRELDENGVDVYYPDHLEDCVMSGSFQRRGESGYRDFRQRSLAVLEFVDDYAEPVEVKEYMGVNKYTKDTFFILNPGKEEDDYVEKAALEKDAVVATYDGDFVDRAVEAATPRRIAAELEL